MLFRSSCYKKINFMFLGKVRRQSATLHDVKILEEFNLKIAEVKISNVCFFTFIFLFWFLNSKNIITKSPLQQQTFLNTSY